LNVYLALYFYELSMITICTESKIFTNSVFESVSKLIENRIWKIDHLTYKTWKNNFNSEEEKFLCACLLDSLLYRSNEQIYSCYHSVFYQHIPSLQYKYPEDFFLKGSILQKLRTKQNLVKLITIDANGAIGKSSHVIANFLIKEFKILPENIISPSDVEEYYDNATMFFIFFDDFLGSGEQFKNQLDFSIKKSWDKGTVLYCPLIAHETGMEYILKAYPNVVIQPVELIRKDYCFFKKYFSNNGNTPENGKIFYEDFMTDKGFTADYYGYGSLAVSIAFEHSSPDNCLAVFNGELINGIYHKLFN